MLHEQEVKGRYVIGSSLALGLVALPKSLAKLLRSHPNLQIDLADETPVRVSEDVVNFKIEQQQTAEKLAAAAS
jgi:DNA-binding transcriptional LysR family regulator